MPVFFFFSSRRRHTRSDRDWSSDVCSSDLKYDWISSVVASSAIIVPPLMPSSGSCSPVPVVTYTVLEAASMAGVDQMPPQIGRASCRGKSVDLGGRRIIKKKKWREKR